MQSGISKIVTDVFINRSGWSDHNETILNKKFVNVVRKSVKNWLEFKDHHYFAAKFFGCFQFGVMDQSGIKWKKKFSTDVAVFEEMFRHSFPDRTNLVFFFNSFIHPFHVQTTVEDLLLPFPLKFFKCPTYTIVRTMVKGTLVRTISNMTLPKKKRRGQFIYSTLRRKLKMGKKMTKVDATDEELAMKEEVGEPSFFHQLSFVLKEEEMAIAVERYNDLSLKM
jgi:hypothetical protein